MKNIMVITIFLIGTFVLGFVAGRIILTQYSLPIQLQGKPYVDIGDMYQHNAAIKDFYVKWKQGAGFAAIRQEGPGIDEPVISYLITENGKLTVIVENKTLFGSDYKEASPDSIAIGYEEPNGTFIEIDPDGFEGHDLKIIRSKK